MSRSRCLFAIALMGLFPLAAVAQTPSPQTAPASEVRVEDVVVEGRRLDEAASSFVGAVAAPVRDRGLARWRDDVCVGVVNLRTEAARYMADRVSTVAADVGLTPGEPGCRPNVVVMATDDGGRLATELVNDRPRDFRTGGAGTNRSSSELREFQTSDRAVRWWHISMPTDSETGSRAVRLPGDAGDGTKIEGSALDYAPRTSVFAASRLQNQIRDDLRRVVIVIDIDAVRPATFEQLADYVAMIALAQIDPAAETAPFNSILNLFDASALPERYLTAWDMAYLKGLYAAEQNRVNPGSHATAVATAMASARRESSSISPE